MAALAQRLKTPKSSLSPSGRAAGPRLEPNAQGRPVVGGIIFDVPDVLYDATLWRRWLVQLVGRLGVRLGHDEFFRAWDAQLVDVYRGRREYDEALESFLLACGLSWALVDEVEAASRIQRQKLEQDVRPLPGVAGVIEALSKRGLPLAAWADAPHPADRLAQRLARLVPAARFDAVLTSFDLELAQPAPECYRALVGALGQSAAQVVYVGHDAAHLAGAAAAGLRTVAFNFQPEARADHYLTRFEDLLAQIETWTLAPRVSDPAGSHGSP
jgi:HAD superfamily hydrolase (TIGR01509 family)